MTASLFTFENLHRAWVDCRRTKRRRESALEFEMDAEKHLFELARELSDRTWHPSRSTCFIARNDKYREVFAAAFRDRVVHHLLVPELERIWEPVFIHDSYACRRGKGTLAAVERLGKFLDQVTRNGTVRAWYLQLDIQSFFPSVDRRRLMKILFSRMEDEELRWLTRKIVLHDPTRDPILRCPQDRWRHIPSGKSLFDGPPHRGLPIGNLTSQFFANVYLNGLDQFVKHRLRCRHYLRYVDDLVLLHNDPKVLQEWKEQIAIYLKKDLGLELHPKRQILKPVSCGIDFLGYIVRRSHVLVRRRTVNGFREKVARVSTDTTRTSADGTLTTISPGEYHRLHSVASSYLGHFGHADTNRLVKSLFKANGLLGLLYDREGSRLRKKWIPPKNLRSLREVYEFFRSLSKGVLVFQVGCYLEMFEENALQMRDSLGLNLIAPREGFSLRCGLHIQYLERLRSHLSKADAVIILQTGRLSGHTMERLPWCFMSGPE